jgi:hypothetical protein
MLSTLTMAISHCRKRKLTVTLLVVGALTAYVVGDRIWTPQFSQYRESKFQSTLGKEAQTSPVFDTAAEKVPVRLLATTPSPSSPTQGSLQQVTRKINTKWFVYLDGEVVRHFLC